MYFSVAMHPLDLWFISVLSDHCFAQMEHQLNLQRLSEETQTTEKEPLQPPKIGICLWDSPELSLITC
jgi:hypothetical protein